MTVEFIRYWRLIWTPWWSLFIGRHNGRRSLWTERRKGDDIVGFYIDIGRERKH